MTLSTPFTSPIFSGFNVVSRWWGYTCLKRGDVVSAESLAVLKRPLGGIPSASPFCVHFLVIKLYSFKLSPPTGKLIHCFPFLAKRPKGQWQTNILWDTWDSASCFKDSPVIKWGLDAWPFGWRMGSFNNYTTLSVCDEEPPKSCSSVVSLDQKWKKKRCSFTHMHECCASI